MVRMIGAALVAVGSAWLGFGAAGELGARVRALEETEEGLSLMAQELELDAPPLEQLMQRLIPRSRGGARRLFEGCQKALEHLEEEPFSLAWQRLVEKEEVLGREGQACLYPLGEVLGRCGWEEQRRILEVTARRLEQAGARAREERGRMSRVYQALGLSGGALAAILLL